VPPAPRSAIGIHPKESNHPRRPMMKTILAAVLASTFLVSFSVRADDKPAGDKTEKADKGSKKDKKDKKADKADKSAGGGGW
jgi:hypothetical protein